MMQQRQETAPLPGLLATLAAGFDLVTRHYWLTLIPAALDSFLWLGPRLGFRSLVEQAVSFWQQQAAQLGMDQELLMTLAPRTNLFSALSVPFVGVPVFMVGLVPEKTPLPAQTVELTSAAAVILLYIGLSLLGLWLSALYYESVAHVVRHDKNGARMTAVLEQALLRSPLTWLSFLGLALTVIMLGLIVYFPLLIASILIGLVSTGLAAMILLLGPVMTVWIVIYLSFAPQGLVLNKRPLWRAVVESVRLIQRYMWSALLLLVGVLLINRGLDWLLLLADDGSWLTLGGILGHAFISTSLLAAIFIFYRDRYAAAFSEVS
ncbi:MAG: hypothetical protein ACE5E7_14415 [Anaerolineae bacterium]